MVTKEMATKVIIVEDEQEIREFLVNQLNDNGFNCLGLASGVQTLFHLQEFLPQIVILDHMMPEKSGADVIKEIRSSTQFSDLPIIMVTGLVGEQDKVKILNLGADDYITKPFNFPELLARVNAVIRRTQGSFKKSQKHLVYQDLEVDFSAHRVTLKGKEVTLTLTEFKILGELLKQTGEVLTRDNLRERALGNMNVTDRTIDVHMTSLRKKLEEMGDVIQTVRGVGYRISI